jgi:hypothetical protein
MGLFNTILEKLGLRKKEEEKASTPAASAKPAVSTAKPTAAPAKPLAAADRPKAVMAKEEPAKAAEPAKPTVAPMSEVDVVKKLAELGAGTNLDWKVSIVDLLKLLNIDSSREARNELATELGCPAELMSDSAKMNAWLHKTVLKKIAENGGNIPQALLD